MKNNVIIIMGILLLGFTNIVSAEKEWTRTEILKMADEEAINNGFDVDTMSVSFDGENSRWNSYLKETEPLNKNNNIEEDLGLKNKNYLALYYTPLDKPSWEGNLWVFIDLDNGKVIRVLIGHAPVH